MDIRVVVCHRYAAGEALQDVGQTENPDLQQKARGIAMRLGLDYEYRFTGYGDMQSAMAEIPVTTIN